MRAVCRDRIFLQKAHHDLNPEDFSDREEAVIVRAATEYWARYKEPIGPMLATEVDDIVADKRFGADSRAKLKNLIRRIEKGSAEAVSVTALVDRVHALKRARFNDTAIEDIITLHEQGKLNARAFQDVVDRARRELDRGAAESVDILSLENFDRRALRRSVKDDLKYPLLFIQPLDEKIRAVGRGQIGMFLAPYKSGKGLALIHVAVAYAMQGLKVLFLTLEDPIEIVEDRYDACLTGIAVNRLAVVPRKLRRLFRRMRKQIRGRIRVVDGTEGGWNVSKIEKLWEQLKHEGFEADAVIVDYDDEIEAEKQFKGESARRFEFADIYRRMRQAASRLNVIWWTAAQTSKKAESKKIVTGQDTVEDVSKVRKAFLVIGIGRDEEVENIKYLYVAAHKHDRSRFGVEIVSDFDSAIFCDQEATRGLMAGRKKSRK